MPNTTYCQWLCIEPANLQRGERERESSLRSEARNGRQPKRTRVSHERLLLACNPISGLAAAFPAISDSIHDCRVLKSELGFVLVGFQTKIPTGAGFGGTGSWRHHPQFAASGGTCPGARQHVCQLLPLRLRVQCAFTVFLQDV